jgi:hypothetical protein
MTSFERLYVFSSSGPFPLGLAPLVLTIERTFGIVVHLLWMLSHYVDLTMSDNLVILSGSNQHSNAKSH